MFINFLSRIVKIFYIIILKIKKILLIIQCYYYYYYLGNNIPKIIMILYRFIHGLIVLISFLKFHLGLGPDIFYVFVDNYIRSSNGDIILYINPRGTRDIPYVISDIPYVISDIPTSMTSSFPSGITNSFPSGVTSGIPSSMTSSFPTSINSEAEFKRIKLKETKFAPIARKRDEPDGPWFYFRKPNGTYVFPEKFHTYPKETICHNDNTLRIYTEKCMTYYYYATYEPNNSGYCIVRYPDGTSIKIENPKVVLDHLLYHQRRDFDNQKYSINYLEWYKQHFKSIKNESTINKLVNSREKITINDLLNIEQDKN